MNKNKIFAVLGLILPIIIAILIDWYVYILFRLYAASRDLRDCSIC